MKGFRILTGGRLISIVTLGLVMIAAVSSVAAAEAKKRDWVTEIDFTDKTKYSIDDVGEVKPLRAFQKDIPHQAYIWGRYRARMALTGGTDILLFPNGKFAVTEWCDICGKPSTLLYGSWQEQSGVISFSVVQRGSGQFGAASQVMLERRIGRFGNFDFFVTAKGQGIGDSVIVPDATITAAPIDRFYVRVEPFVDWEKDLSEVQEGLAPKPQN